MAFVSIAIRHHVLALPIVMLLIHRSIADDIFDAESISLLQVSSAYAVNQLPHSFSADSTPKAHIPLDGDREALRQERMKRLVLKKVVPFTAVTMVALMAGSLVASWKYTRLIPESAVTVAVAAFGGFVFSRHHLGFTDLEVYTDADAELLNLALMPIIIFNSGWSIHRHLFVSEFEYICIFAVFGTLVTMVLVAFASYGLGVAGAHPVTGLRENLAFGALISATDPVATLHAYSILKIPAKQPLLNIMVSGESLINDAVAIVLFEIINGSGSGVHILSLHNLWLVIWLLVGSLAYGFICAALLVITIRFTGLRGRTQPLVIFICLSAYLIFSTATACGFSGIIANLIGGMVMRRFGAANLTHAAEHEASETYEMLANTADTIVFIMCGFSVAFFHPGNGAYTFGFVAVALCLISRAIAVPLCAGASNILKRAFETEPSYFSWQYQVMMWLGGLRGGIALLLSLELDESWCSKETRLLIVQGTFVVVGVLMVSCGAATEVMLSVLGLAGPDPSVKVDEEWESDDEAAEAAAEMLIEKKGTRRRQLSQYFVPYLVGDEAAARSQALERSSRDSDRA